MGLLTGKADVVANMPQYNSKAENWISWHKDLKSNFGKKIANGLWLKAWRIRGGSDQNTSELRSYMEKQGVKIDKSVFNSVTDAGIGFIDGVGNFLQMGATASLVMGIVVVGGLGYIIYKAMKNPDGTKNLVMMATPQGRAVSMLGGLKK
jgi:hypothetical protein